MSSTISSGEMFLTGVHAIDTDSFSVTADEDASGYPLNWTLFGYGICFRMPVWTA